MLRTFSDDDLKATVKDSISYTEVIKKLGLHICGGNQRTIRSHISRLNLDTSHFLGKSWNIKNTFGLKNHIKRDLSTILVVNSTYINVHHLKMRLIKEGIFEHKCYKCNRTEWEGEPIPIQLDHKNGIRTDNRIENLIILCPNCHAQTPTYCGKNIRIKNRKVIERKNKLSKIRNVKKSLPLKKILMEYRIQRELKDKERLEFFSNVDKITKEVIKEASIKLNVSSVSGVRYLFNKYKSNVNLTKTAL